MTIEAVLDKAYAARRNNDAEAAAACFTPEGQFGPNGVAAVRSHKQRVDTLQTMFDAFVLRTVLVPAAMHLFGRANWWLPRWLDRRLPRLAVDPETSEVPRLPARV